MKVSKLSNLKPKKLIVFDLDGTLAPTKAQMDAEMADLVKRLLMQKKVAVIGGGKFELFKYQFLSKLKVPKELLRNLFLFPTTATTFLRYRGDPPRPVPTGASGPERRGWQKVYEHKFTSAQIKKIFIAIRTVLKEINYQAPKKTYGRVVENRGSQVTWSALGQDVVKVLGKKGIALKNQWRNKNTPLKLKIARHLKKYLPEFEIHAAGYTSIDVTKKGIDKAYGLKQIEKYLGVKIKDILFVGDAIFKGGNDYAIIKTPVDYVAVKGPKEAKKVIRTLLK